MKMFKTTLSDGESVTVYNTGASHILIYLIRNQSILINLRSYVDRLATLLKEKP